MVVRCIRISGCDKGERERERASKVKPARLAVAPSLFIGIYCRTVHIIIANGLGTKMATVASGQQQQPPQCPEHIRTGPHSRMTSNGVDDGRTAVTEAE